MSQVDEDDLIAWLCPDQKWHLVGRSSNDQAWTVCGKWLVAWWDFPQAVFSDYPMSHAFLICYEDRCYGCTEDDYGDVR